MRRRRGSGGRVLAEVPPPRGDAARPGALKRDEIEAYSRLARELTGARVVLVTGPAKARVALGLATLAAAEGRRAALLEADLASPSLATELGLEPAPGLHEYLRGEVGAQEALQLLVLAGPAAGRAAEPLACVVAGVPGPASLLDSERCRAAIGGMRASYERVVIDGAPLDAERLALIALAEAADATLACGSRRELRRLPIPVSGLVAVG